MSTPDFSTLVARHRAYFRTGATRSAQWREAQLTALRAMMTDRAEDFHAALWTDLRRNRTDADLIDIIRLLEMAHQFAPRPVNHRVQIEQVPLIERTVEIRQNRLRPRGSLPESVSCLFKPPLARVPRGISANGFAAEELAADLLIGLVTGNE